jgi:hypothetical protein
MIEGIHFKGCKVFVETLAIRIRNPKEGKKMSRMKFDLLSSFPFHFLH